MSVDELTELPARDAVGAMANGKLSRADYAKPFLENAEKHDSSIGAFLELDAKRALSALEKAPAGPLSGLTVAVKDNIETLGYRTTCGSRMLEHYRPMRNATVIERLLAAGAVVAGKTNLDEFAMGSSNENSAFGPCRNPWDLERVPGGSSGGSAAAVAARMAPVALGSDTGGSVRQPAALCGIVGIKPTWGRVSRSGLVAFASSLDQIGVFGKRVDDVALVLEVIAGHDSLDATSSSIAVGPYDGSSKIENLEGVTIGVIAEAVEMLEGEVKENFDRSLATLRNGGAEVREVSIPMLPYSIATYYIIANAEASANLARYDGVRYGHRSERPGTLEELYTRSRTEGFGPEVKRRIMLGTFALSSGYYDAYYGRAQRVRERIRRDVDAALAEVDALISPTTPEPAFRIGEKIDDPLSMYLNDVMTASANLSGHPAIAIPSGFTGEGLPLSLQITGPAFGEAKLFEIGGWFERATDAIRRPPLLS